MISGISGSPGLLFLIRLFLNLFILLSKFFLNFFFDQSLDPVCSPGFISNYVSPDHDFNNFYKIPDFKIFPKSDHSVYRGVIV